MNCGLQSLSWRSIVIIIQLTKHQPLLVTSVKRGTSRICWQCQGEKDKYLQKYCTADDETWWGLRSQVYQGPEVFSSGWVMSSWNKMRYNSLVAKVTRCNSPFTGLVLYSLDNFCFSLDVFVVSVSVSTLRIRSFQSRSRYRHWDSDLFSLGLGLVIETQTFSVSVSLLRLRHFQSRSRSRWSKSGLADPCEIPLKNPSNLHETLSKSHWHLLQTPLKLSWNTLKHSWHWPPWNMLEIPA